MANKQHVYMVDKADLKKLPRGEQRRLLDLGMVKGEEPPAVAAEKDDAKAKPGK